MYYLGKHKGTPDDSYTHSSKSSEKFCSIVPHKTTPINERREFFKNMPKGVTRRILAYGTDEEMCILEHELLVNRKERCWDRYYNESLGDPRYVDTSGKNNPMYGKNHSLETKEKIAVSRMGRVQNNVKKQVLELTSMMLFDSVEEAAKHYGVTSSTMSVLVRDEVIKRGKCKNKRFVYVSHS